MRLMCAERDRLWAEYDAALRSYLVVVDRWVLGGEQWRWRKEGKPTINFTKLVATSYGTSRSTAAILTQNRS